MAIVRPPYLDPLSEEEFGRFEIVLQEAELGCTMDVEQVDGFFAGLIAGPPIPRPCHYWPVIFGKEPGDSAALQYLRTDSAMLPLLARHWHAVWSTLQQDRIHLPYLSLDETAPTAGRQWSRGFLLAVQLHPDAWHVLICNDDLGGALLPMMILAHQEDPNTQLRSPPLSARTRGELLRQLAAGVFQANRYFEPAKRLQHTVDTHLEVN